MPNKDSKKAVKPTYKKDLILLFSVPIGIAILVAAMVNVPKLSAHPKYDFVFSYCQDYDCRDAYHVDLAGHITDDNDEGTVTGNLLQPEQKSQLRYYDASNDSSRPLSLEQAQRYGLDSSTKSPDGYTLQYDSNDSGFLFWSEHSDGWYLGNGVKKKPIHGLNNNSYSQRDIRFIGWVRE